MWYLSILKLTLSQPLIIFIVAIIALAALSILFFGTISGYYALYHAKAIVCVVVNVFATIGNAVYFAVHGLTQLLYTAFLDMINGIAEFFLVPIINAINEFAVWLTIASPGDFFLELDPIGIGTNISPQPPEGFSYYVPASVVGPGASIWGFIAVHPGEQLYSIDDEGKIIYDEVFDQNGAKLLFPRIAENAKADGWWDTISDRPPPWDYTFTFGLESYTTTWISTLNEWLSNAITRNPIVTTILDILNGGHRAPESWNDLVTNPGSILGLNIDPYDKYFNDAIEHKLGWWEARIFIAGGLVGGDYSKLKEEFKDYCIDGLKDRGFKLNDYAGINHNIMIELAFNFVNERMDWWVV